MVLLLFLGKGGIEGKASLASPRAKGPAFSSKVHANLMCVMLPGLVFAAAPHDGVLRHSDSCHVESSFFNIRCSSTLPSPVTGGSRGIKSVRMLRRSGWGQLVCFRIWRFSCATVRPLFTCVVPAKDASWPTRVNHLDAATLFQLHRASA